MYTAKTSACPNTFDEDEDKKKKKLEKVHLVGCM